MLKTYQLHHLLRPPYAEPRKPLARSSHLAHQSFSSASSSSSSSTATGKLFRLFRNAHHLVAPNLALRQAEARSHTGQLAPQAAKVGHRAHCIRPAAALNRELHCCCRRHSHSRSHSQSWSRRILVTGSSGHVGAAEQEHGNVRDVRNDIRRKMGQEQPVHFFFSD